MQGPFSKGHTRVPLSPLRPLLSKCAQRRQLSLALISLWGPSPECVPLHFPTWEVCLPGLSDAAEKAAGILSSVRWVFKTLTVFIPLHLGHSLWVLKCPRWKGGRSFPSALGCVFSGPSLDALLSRIFSVTFYISLFLFCSFLASG